jgi:hypothetical protein
MPIIIVGIISVMIVIIIWIISSKSPIIVVWSIPTAIIPGRVPSVMPGRVPRPIPPRGIDSRIPGIIPTTIIPGIVPASIAIAIAVTDIQIDGRRLALSTKIEDITFIFVILDIHVVGADYCDFGRIVKFYDSLCILSIYIRNSIIQHQRFFIDQCIINISAVIFVYIPG